MSKAKEGGRGTRKYGRRGRAPSGASQMMRSEKNRRKRKERAEREKLMQGSATQTHRKVARGTARAKRRGQMGWNAIEKAKQNRKVEGIKHAVEARGATAFTVAFKRVGV